MEKTDEELIKMYCESNNIPETFYGKLLVSPEYILNAMRVAIDYGVNSSAMKTLDTEGVQHAV
jgi:hypothetical protein